MATRGMAKETVKVSSKTIYKNIWNELDPLKVLWLFKNIFKTLHDLNDIDEKTKMLKTPS